MGMEVVGGSIQVVVVLVQWNVCDEIFYKSSPTSTASKAEIEAGLMCNLTLRVYS